MQVQHYHKDNTKGELYSELFPMNINVWRMIKDLQGKYLNQIEGEDVPTKHFIVTSIDARSSKILRIINYKENIKEIISNLEKSDELFRIN